MFKSLLFWLAGEVSWLAVEVLSSCENKSQDFWNKISLLLQDLVCNTVSSHTPSPELKSYYKNLNFSESSEKFRASLLMRVVHPSIFLHWPDMWQCDIRHEDIIVNFIIFIFWIFFSFHNFYCYKFYLWQFLTWQKDKWINQTE